MALVTTAGGASSDSYISAADAATYFASVGMLADWTTYAVVDDEELLRRAMMELEERDFLGSRANNDAGTSTYQALEFPRKSTFYLGAAVATDGTVWTDRRGRRYADDEIPMPIKHAQCWLALAIGINEYQATNEQGDSIEFSAGSVTIKPKESATTVKLKRARREAEALLHPFLASQNGRTMRN